MSEISSCPRSGCSGYGRVRTQHLAGATYKNCCVECGVCRMRGPVVVGRREAAIAEWNALGGHVDAQTGRVTDSYYHDGVTHTTYESVGKCPRANCDGIGYLDAPTMNSSGVQIRCRMCGMRGPISSSGEEAITEWNALHVSTKQEECPERLQEQVEPVVNACPICQDHPDVHVDAWPSGIKSVWVECACGTEGAIGKSKQEAIEYWNMLSSGGDGWISVEDKLPKEKTSVLAFDGLVYRIAQIGRWSRRSPELTWICSLEGLSISVSFWRPLPNLPIQEKCKDIIKERACGKSRDSMHSCPACMKYPDLHICLWPSSGKVCSVQAMCECGLQGRSGGDREEAIRNWNALSGMPVVDSAGAGESIEQSQSARDLLDWLSAGLNAWKKILD